MQKRLVLPGLLAFYLMIAFTQASLKLIWVDEFFTLYIAQQHHFKGVWRALAAGADPNPPLIHLLVKASIATFGVNPVALRLPSILAVLLAILSLWWILRKHLPPLYAAVGVLAFMATRGFDYAYDSRSYALLMAFCMTSMATWICASANSGLRRAAALCALAVSLAAGVSSNYYGVLAFFPVALGEALRPRRRPGVWLALALASLPLLAYLPLIRHNIAEFTPHAWNRPHAGMIPLTYLELVEGIFWPVLALALFTLWRKPAVPSNLPRPETAALGTLILFPFLGFLLAVAGAGMISPRCVAPVCCAFGLAAAFLAHRVFAHRPQAAPWLVALLFCWVFVRETACAAILLQQRQAFFALKARIAEAGSEYGPPVLVGDSALVLPLYFYSSEYDRHHILFPIDFSAIHRFEPDDSGEQNLWAGRNGVFPVPIFAFADAWLTPGTVVLARPNGWLVRDIEARGLHLEPQPSDPNWGRLGGVFTPMAHPETRIMILQP